MDNNNFGNQQWQNNQYNRVQNGYSNNGIDEYTNNQQGYIPGYPNNQASYNQYNNINGYNQPQNMNIDGYSNQYNSNNGYNQQHINNKSNKRIKQKKPKRKKGFISKLLNLILMIIIVYIVIKFNNNLAEKEMQGFISDYPFEFSDQNNSLRYITDNFKVTTEYTKGDKQYKVKWKSSSKNIDIDDEGNIYITKPTNSSENVILTEIYRKWLGKAEKSYIVTLIPTNTISSENIDIVTVESIKNNTYDNEMDVILDESGNLQMMLGDFNNTYIYSSEDANTLLETYKYEFDIDNNITEDIHFSFNNISNSNLLNTYRFNVLYKDIPIDNTIATVVVNNNTYELVKISIPISDISNISLDETEPEYNKIIDEYIKEQFGGGSNRGNDDINTVENQETQEVIDISTLEREIIPLETIIYNNKIAHKYIVIFDNLQSYTITIQDNLVVNIEDSIHSILGEYKSAKCTGYSERGDRLQFDASSKTGKLSKNTDYALYDPKSKITTCRSLANYQLSSLSAEAFSKGEANKATALGLIALPEQLIGNLIKEVITSDSSEFSREEAVGAESHYGVQIAYNYYKDKFGLLSYDNKGSKIIILTDNNIQYDNAAWHKLWKLFIVNKPGSMFGYIPSVNPEVMCHEYTHAVFDTATQGASGGEASGIDEAYADIMASLIYPKCGWVIGRNIYPDDLHWKDTGELAYAKGEEFIFRDLRTINSDKTFRGIIYPTQYKGEGWTGEEHDISVLLSNIAYKMHNSTLFTDDDVANIWYNSMYYGYDKNSTYVTCRKFVIKSAEDQSYTPEQIDFIAKCFDEAAIYDESYKWKVDKDKEQSKTTSDNTQTISSSSKAILGDPIYDNTTPRRYIRVFSPIQLLLGKGKIVIYEENTEVKGSTKNYSEKDIENMINAIRDDGIEIEYKRISPAVMNIVEKFCNNSKSTIKSLTNSYIDKSGADNTSELKELSSSFLDKWSDWIFTWDIQTITPYKFYNSMKMLD